MIAEKPPGGVAISVRSQEDSFHAIIIGETPISPDLLGDNFTHMHYISERARLSSLFRCSDFVINTSHDETLARR